MKCRWDTQLKLHVCKSFVVASWFFVCLFWRAGWWWCKTSIPPPPPTSEAVQPLTVTDIIFNMMKEATLLKTTTIQHGDEARDGISSSYFYSYFILTPLQSTSYWPVAQNHATKYKKLDTPFLIPSNLKVYYNLIHSTTTSEIQSAPQRPRLGNLSTSFLFANPQPSLCRFPVLLGPSSKETSFVSVLLYVHINHQAY